MKRLHIVGCPRSGTTLMMELMVTCFDRDGYCDHEMSVFEEPPGRPRLFFSKQPNDIRYIRRIFERDPNLFVLHMQRDPRAVITSEHRSQPGMYFCNFRVWRDCYRADLALADHPRFLRVRYEDLTGDPDGTQHVIQMRFPFLVRRHAFSEYQNHAQPSAGAEAAMGGMRPVTADRPRRWTEHLPRIKAQWLKHPDLTQVLVDCQYEPDERWTEMLGQVTAREFPCRYPEKARPLKRLETNIRKYLQSRAYLSRHGLA